MKTLLTLRAAAVLFNTGCATAQKARLPKEKDLTGYLLVYFKDQDHSLYFALSSDGYTFTDVNHSHPIMQGTNLAEQKGIRDPHIVRGPDNAFYLSMTDLHIFWEANGLSHHRLGARREQI